MIRLIAEYKIEEGVEEKVLKAIREFVAAVHREEPETEYRAFRFSEGSDFLHIMAFPDEAAENRHREAEYTRKFVKVLYPNCKKDPTFTTITEIE